jgi:hypothetical protein
VLQQQRAAAEHKQRQRGSAAAMQCSSKTAGHAARSCFCGVLLQQPCSSRREYEECLPAVAAAMLVLLQQVLQCTAMGCAAVEQTAIWLRSTNNLASRLCYGVRVLAMLCCWQAAAVQQ